MSERPRMPYIDLFNWLGLYTKGSNEVVSDTQLRDAKNTDFFTSYGAISKPPGTSRVLSAATNNISWVGFYKAADLNGAILRHVLCSNGTVLARVTGTAGSASATALTGTGYPRTATRTSALIHDSAMYEDFLLITNQDPDLIGSGDELVKYDGDQIHKWGVVAPGSQETEADSFTTTSTWTASACSIADETTTTQDGNAMSMTSNGVTTEFYATKTVTAFAISATIANRGRVYCYIPRGQMENFAAADALQVRVGPSTGNYYRFDFDVGALVEGWNALTLDYSSPTATVGTPGTTALDELRVGGNAGASKTVAGIVWDKFIYYDTGALTSAEGAADSTFADAATYKYRVTFQSKYGHESNGGPVSSTLTLTAGRSALTLTAIPTSTDPQVTSRKIYRTVNGGSVYLYVATVYDNTTTTYSDTTGDTSLSSTQPPLAGDTSDDNSPPVKAGIVKPWRRTVFLAGDPSSPHNVYFSEDGEPESFPTLNRATLDAKITAMYETYSALIIETELGKWQVTGDNPDFRFDKIINNIGCVGRRAAGETRVDGWAVDRDGMRLYNATEPHKISEPIRDKFDDDFDKSNIELLHTFPSKRRNLIGMFVADSSGDYTSQNYIYQYPLDDVSKGWWWQLDLPSTVNVQHVAEVEDSDGTFHLYAAGGSDGMIYKLFDPNSKNWVASDGTARTMTTTAQTKWFRPGPLGGEIEAATGRVTPRMVEMRISGDAAVWTALVETANGPDQTTVTDSQTVTLTFAANQTLLRVPVPAMQSGEYVRMTITNAEQDVSSTVLGLRLYIKVRPGQFPVEPGDMDGS